MNRISAFIISITFISGTFNLSQVSLYDFELRFFMLLVLVSWCSWFIFSQKKIKINKFVMRDILVMLLFIFSISITLLWSQDLAHGFEKFKDLFVLIFIVLCSALLISKEPFNMVRNILQIFMFISLIYASVSIFTSLSASRGSILIGGPNVATRVMFFGLVATLFLNSIKERFRYKLYIALIAAGIISIGSRGGLASAILAFVLFSTFYYTPNIFLFFKKIITKGVIPGFVKKIDMSTSKLFLLALIIGISVFLIKQTWHVVELRYIDLLIDRLHYADRNTILNDFIEIIKDNILFGVGLGGHANYGFAYYPHNLFIELTTDGGLFLLFFSLVYLFFLFRRGVKFKSAKFLFIAMTYMMLSQQFSGGYYDFRYFFLFAICYSFLVNSPIPASERFFMDLKNKHIKAQALT
jgi:O-antigen ligase